MRGWLREGAEKAAALEGLETRCVADGEAAAGSARRAVDEINAVFDMLEKKRVALVEEANKVRRETCQGVSNVRKASQVLRQAMAIAHSAMDDLDLSPSPSAVQRASVAEQLLHRVVSSNELALARVKGGLPTFRHSQTKLGEWCDSLLVDFAGRAGADDNATPPTLPIPAQFPAPAQSPAPAPASPKTSRVLFKAPVSSKPPASAQAKGRTPAPASTPPKSPTPAKSPRSRATPTPVPAPAPTRSLVDAPNQLPVPARLSQDELIEEGYALFLRNCFTEAIAVFKKCKGNCVALGYHAILLWVGGGGVVKDRTASNIVGKRAIAAGLEAKAAEGDPHAQFALGYLHFNADVVERDHDKSVALHLRAASRGHAGATHCLGNWFDYGAPVPDKAKAVRLYAKAAEMGSLAAQIDLGTCYENGEGVDKDLTKAVALFRVGAEMGLALAQNNLGNCYLNALGTEKDEKRAVELFDAAVRQGNTLAMRNLAWCYQFGKGVPKDHKKCLELEVEAATLGDAAAQFGVAQCYYQGIGTRVDKAKVRHYLRLSAMQFHEPAVISLRQFEEVELAEQMRKGLAALRPKPSKGKKQPKSKQTLTRKQKQAQRKKGR